VKTINKGIITAAILGASAFAASAAQASDGTVTINGQVVAQTCVIDINGQGANPTVTLPTVQTSALPSVGKVAGRTGFTMSLSGCATTAPTGAGSGNVRAFFEQGPNVDPTTGFLINRAPTTLAANVQVGIVNASDAVSVQGLNLNAPAATQGETNVAIAATGPTLLNYAAQYVVAGGTSSATIGASAGGVSTSVTYALHFN